MIIFRTTFRGRLRACRTDVLRCVRTKRCVFKFGRSQSTHRKGTQTNKHGYALRKNAKQKVEVSRKESAAVKKKRSAKVPMLSKHCIHARTKKFVSTLSTVPVYSFDLYYKLFKLLFIFATLRLKMYSDEALRDSVMKYSVSARELPSAWGR